MAKSTFKICSRFGKDRGIYFPDNITPLSKDFIQNISEYSNHEIAYEVIKQFVDEIRPKTKRNY
jgi:threonine synthase